MAGAIPKPQLWEPDYPALYHVICTLRVAGKEVDTREIPLGIRTVKWDVNTGFYINGHHVKLHGWGQKPTDEWPGLGAAQPDWMHYYTLSLMKEAGGNFVRWGHCAAAPAMLDAGDRLGIIAEQPGVDGEGDTVTAWTIRAAALRDMIIYFRNHPSILIWEGGNQKVIREHAKELRGYMDQYDPHGGRAYAHRRADQVTAEFMDIGIGTEGGREIAKLPVVEGEYDREESPRRVWDDFSPPNFGYPEAKGQTYDLTSEQYAVNQVTQYIRRSRRPIMRAAPTGFSPTLPAAAASPPKWRAQAAKWTACVFPKKPTTYARRCSATIRRSTSSATGPIRRIRRRPST